MLAGNATPAEIGGCWGAHHFVIQKLEKQARLFEMDELEAILRRTLEVDQGIKTGRIAGRLALEMLAVEICHRRAPPKPPRTARRARRR